MKVEKINKNVGEVLNFIGEKDLGIEEKIAVLKSAADLLMQVLTMETTVLSMQKIIELNLNKLK